MSGTQRLSQFLAARAVFVEIPVDHDGLFMTKQHGFDAEECAAIIALSKTRGVQMKGATVSGNGKRRSNVVWLDRTHKETRWVYERLLGMVEEADRVWGFGVGPPRDQIQVAMYAAGSKGTYDCAYMYSHTYIHRCSHTFASHTHTPHSTPTES